MSFSNSKQQQDRRDKNTLDKKSRPKKDDFTNFEGNLTEKKGIDRRDFNYDKDFNQDWIESTEGSLKSYKNKGSRVLKGDAYDYDKNVDNGYNKGHRYSKKYETQTKARGEAEYLYVKKETPKQEALPQKVNEFVDNHSKTTQNENKKQDREPKDKNKDSQKNRRVGFNSNNKGKDYGVIYYIKKTSSEEVQNAEQKDEKKKFEKKPRNRQDGENNKEQNEDSAINITQDLNQINIQKDDRLQDIQEPQKNIVNSVHLDEIIKTETKEVPERSRNSREIDRNSVSQPSKIIKGTSLLLNENDKISQTASKPLFEFQSTNTPNKSNDDDKDHTSLCSDAESTHSKAHSIPHYPQPQVAPNAMTFVQPPSASVDQQKILYVPSFGIQQIPQFSNMFQTPYIVFPQPNGTSIIQPFYQMPQFNVAYPLESDQTRLAQPYYVVQTVPLQNLESQTNDDKQAQRTTENQRVQQIPTAQMNPQFYAFPPMHPGFTVAPLMTNGITMQTMHMFEKDVPKSATSDSQSLKEDASSDKRDD